MPNRKYQISGVKIKQVFLILIICALLGLIVYNLSLFIPSLLGAVTLYVVSRNLNFYLQEERKWKPVWSSLVIILICLVVLIIPVYLLANMIVQKLGESQVYMAQFNVFLEKIHNYVYQKVHIDILSKSNLDKLKDNVGKWSTAALSGTLNTVSVIGSMFFILYFIPEVMS